MNNIALATALFTEPARAFEAIAAKPRWAFPLWMVVVTTLGVMAWYYAKVDLIWLFDATLRANPRTAALPEEMLQTMIQRGASPISTGITLASLAVILVLIRLLEAAWYALVGKVTNVDRSYRQWFALACWTSLPQVLAALSVVPVLLTLATTQIDASTIAPLSLNDLFFHRKLGEPGHDYFVGINLMQFVGLGLAIVGVRLWSRRSWLYAGLFVLIPPLLIYGAWGWFALGRS